MTDQPAILANRLDNGSFHEQIVPTYRQAIRQTWARIIERTDHAHDAQEHPYTNWGYKNRLDWVLSQHGRGA